MCGHQPIRYRATSPPNCSITHHYTPSTQRARLLAIGDSITKGAIPSDERNAPYMQFTQAELEASLEGCFAVEATVAGAGLSRSSCGR